MILGPISRTDLSLFWDLNLIQSDSWLSISLFVKLAPGRLTRNLWEKNTCGALLKWQVICEYIKIWCSELWCRHVKENWIQTYVNVPKKSPPLPETLAHCCKAIYVVHVIRIFRSPSPHDQELVTKNTRQFNHLAYCHEAQFKGRLSLEHPSYLRLKWYKKTVW